VALALALLPWPTSARAQPGLRALPAVWLTPRASVARAHSVLASAHVGYGVMGAVAGTQGTHQRALGGLAVAYAAPFGLSLELRVDGRWDVHKVPGGDDSLVGEPRLFLRYARAWGERARLGLETAIWVPGAVAPSLDFAATSVDILALFELTLPHGLALVTALGPRFDRSARSVSSELTLSRSDQLSLGVSSFHALLARVALEAQVGAAHAALELSADTLLGTGAPAFLRSPIRAALSARHPLGLGFEVAALAALLLSARPSLHDDAYVPFEPRFQCLVGAIYRLPAKESARRAPAARVPVSPSEAPAPAREAPVTPADTLGTLLVIVQSADGELLPDAQVTLASGPALRTGGSGSARFGALAPGSYLLSIHAHGFATETLRAELSTGATVELRAVMQPAQTDGILRILVRDAERGSGLFTRLTISPLQRGKHKPIQARSGADGRFERALPAGRYRVLLRSEGYRTQTREADVSEQGVTLFNVDLTPVSR
jgi:hypothetical protein